MTYNVHQDIIARQNHIIETIDDTVVGAIKQGKNFLFECGLRYIETLITDGLECSVFCNTVAEEAFKSKTVKFVRTYLENRLLDIPAEEQDEDTMTTNQDAFQFADIFTGRPADLSEAMLGVIEFQLADEKVKPTVDIDVLRDKIARRSRENIQHKKTIGKSVAMINVYKRRLKGYETDERGIEVLQGNIAYCNEQIGEHAAILREARAGVKSNKAYIYGAERIVKRLMAETVS